MSRNSYATRNEAIQREIIDPIEALGEFPNARKAFDIPAIAKETIVFDRHTVTFRYREDIYFWAVVYKHAI